MSGREISLVPFLLFLGALPLGEIGVVPGFAWLSLTKLSFFFLLAYLGLECLRGWRPPVYPRLSALLGLFLVGALVSTLFSGRCSISFPYFLRFLALSLLCLITAWMTGEAGTVRKIGGALLFTGAVLSLLGIYQTLSGDTIGGLGYYGAFGRMITLGTSWRGSSYSIVRASGTFDHPNLFGVFLTAAIPFGFVSLIDRPLRSPSGLLSCLGLLLCLTALVYTFSRGAWLGMAAGLAVLTFRQRGGGKAVVLTVGAAVFAVIIISPAGRIVLFGRGDKIQPYDNVRLHSYQAAVSMIVSHPWTGLGPGTFDANYARYRGPGQTISQSPRHKMDAHNTFLGLGAENGLPVLAIFVIIFAVVSFSLQRILRSGGRDLSARALLAALISLAVQGMFNSLQYQEIFWIILGSGWAVGGIDSRTNREKIVDCSRAQEG